MTCRICSAEMTSAEAAAYGERCETCWSVGHHDAGRPHQRKAYPGVPVEMPVAVPRQVDAPPAVFVAGYRGRLKRIPE